MYKQRELTMCGGEWLVPYAFIKQPLCFAFSGAANVFLILNADMLGLYVQTKNKQTNKQNKTNIDVKNNRRKRGYYLGQACIRAHQSGIIVGCCTLLKCLSYSVLWNWFSLDLEQQGVFSAPLTGQFSGHTRQKPNRHERSWQICTLLIGQRNSDHAIRTVQIGSEDNMAATPLLYSKSALLMDVKLYKYYKWLVMV